MSKLFKLLVVLFFLLSSTLQRSSSSGFLSPLSGSLYFCIQGKFSNLVLAFSIVSMDKSFISFEHILMQKYLYWAERANKLTSQSETRTYQQHHAGWMRVWGQKKTFSVAFMFHS
jgi:hypothetical protein